MPTTQHIVFKTIEFSRAEQWLCLSIIVIVNNNIIIIVIMVVYNCIVLS